MTLAVGPTALLAALRPPNWEAGIRHLDVLKWGLVPYFTKDLKTASDTLTP
jgi:hypothetical protein